MSIDVTGGATQEGALEALAEWVAGLIGTACTLHLYNAPFTAARSSVYADFLAAEPTDAWYAAQAITWGTPGFDALGVANVLSDRVEWLTAAPVTSQVVNGLWASVQTAVGPPAVDVAVSYYAFPAPQTVDSVGRLIGAVLKLTATGFPGLCTVEV